MKLILVKPCNVVSGNSGGTNSSAFACEGTENVSSSLSAGDRELVLAALVSKEGVDIRLEGVGWNKLGDTPNFIRALNGLCEVIRFEGYEASFSATLKIEPVKPGVMAPIDASSGGITHDECPFSATDGGDGKHKWKESSRYDGDCHCVYCGNYKSGRPPL